MSRVYEMTIEGNEWKLWRHGLAEDGVDLHTDFDLNHHRVE